MEQTNEIIRNENDGTMVAEPVVALKAENDTYATSERYSIPLGMPQTVEEALTALEEGEREFERRETFSHREVMQMVWSKIDNYIMSKETPCA